ncbi:MAG: extracellular solute-binding protein [Eubacteriales bacterium]|nr:extracellular solute-binding protein [Eubacteriales bacterium]
MIAKWSKWCKTIRNITIFIAFISILISASSCSTKQNATHENTIRETRENSTQGNSDNKEQSIKIYLQSDYGTNYINQALDVFSAKFPEAVLNKEIIKDTEVYRNRISTELMAGEGPDLILFEYYTPDIYRMSELGVFYDLNSLISQDKEFDMDKYFNAVMDCGIINDKRYLIPITYTIPAFMTTEEIMEANGMVYDMANWTWEYLSDFMVNYCMNDSNEITRYFSDYYFQFDDCLYSSGIDFIDRKNKVTCFENQEFKEILEVYKKIFAFSKQTHSAGQDMKANELFSINAFYMLSPREARTFQSDIKYYTDGTIRMIPFPTYDGKSGLTANAGTIAAINNNSGNKETAYEFIKILLSDEIQKKEFAAIPVSSEAFNSMLEEYSKDTEPKKWGTIYAYNLDDKLVEDIRNIAGNIKRCIIKDNFSGIFHNKALDFATCKYTLQECIDRLENEVMLILNE